MELQELDIAVIGLARTGRACVWFLAGRCRRLVAADAKPAAALAEAAAEATAAGAVFVPDLSHLQQLGPVDLIVKSPGVPAEATVVREARARGVRIISEIELAYAVSPLPLVAVSGTNGKGSTCGLLAGMFEAAAISCRVAGNIGWPLIEAVAQPGDAKLIVAEVSSFQLEDIETFRPRVAVLLNVTPDHLERHGTFEAYVAAKRRLFENQAPDDWAVGNADDEVARALTEQSRARVLLFSTSRQDAAAGVHDGSIVVDVGSGGEAVCPTTDLVRQGRHYLQTVLAAALAARVSGAPVEAIAAGIRAHRLGPHILEHVCTVRGVRFINSTKATSPAAAEADIESVEGPLHIIAGGSDKHADFTEIGALMARRARGLYLIGQCAERLGQAAAGARGERFATLEEAVRAAYRAAQPGETVLLAPACASLDMFRDYAHRGEVFRETARAICAEEGGGEECCSS